MPKQLRGLNKGTSQEEVVAKMVKTGFPEEKAKTFVNTLATELGLISPSETQESKGTEEEANEKDNPVHKYI